MADSTFVLPAESRSRRVQQMDALVAELRAIFPHTKGDPKLELRCSLLIGHAIAVRETLHELEKLALDLERA